MMNVTADVSGQVTAIEEKSTKNGKPFYKFTIEYGDKKSTVNCSSKEASVGEHVSWKVGVSEITGSDGKQYNTKWYRPDKWETSRDQTAMAVGAPTDRSLIQKVLDLVTQIDKKLDKMTLVVPKQIGPQSEEISGEEAEELFASLE